MNNLQQEFVNFCRDNNLPHMVSVDELLMLTLTKEQRQYLNRFSKRYDTYMRNQAQRVAEKAIANMMDR